MFSTDLDENEYLIINSMKNMTCNHFLFLGKD